MKNKILAGVGLLIILTIIGRYSSTESSKKQAKTVNLYVECEKTLKGLMSMTDTVVVRNICSCVESKISPTDTDQVKAKNIAKNCFTEEMGRVAKKNSN